MPDDNGIVVPADGSTGVTGTSGIQTTKAAYLELYPAFSFRKANPDHRRYRVKDKCKKDDLHHFIHGLLRMSEFPWKQIEGTKHMFHMHEVPNKEGLPVPEGFVLLQFKAFQEARVIGYFNRDNIFEIVLFDRNHEYCPSENWK